MTGSVQIRVSSKRNSYLNPDKSDNGKAYMLLLVPTNYLLTKLGLQALQEHDMYKSLQ